MCIHFEINNEHNSMWHSTDVNDIDIVLVFSTGVIRNFLACLSKLSVFIRNWSACFEKASFLYAGSYCIHIYTYIYHFSCRETSKSMLA